jgi:hypothetical protein
MATFIARLRHAPYPYDGNVGDERRPFFDAVKDGQRVHTTVRDTVFAEHPHYSDDRVLFHAPRRFDPARPFQIVVFFHGHNAELRRTVLGELQVARQLDAAGRNRLLIAPQLARDAADSAPGKLYRRGGLKRLLEEAGPILARRIAGLTPARLRRAPIVLAAYSGGYRATAYCLDRGGVTPRIAGIVLLDALYGEQDRLARWIGHGTGFAVMLGGPSTAKGHAELRRRLMAAGLPIRAALPRRLAPGDIVMTMTPTSHRLLPLIGPPLQPLAAALSRCD